MSITDFHIYRLRGTCVRGLRVDEQVIYSTRDACHITGIGLGEGPIQLLQDKALSGKNSSANWRDVEVGTS